MIVLVTQEGQGRKVWEPYVAVDLPKVEAHNQRMWRAWGQGCILRPTSTPRSLRHHFRHSSQSLEAKVAADWLLSRTRQLYEELRVAWREEHDGVWPAPAQLYQPYRTWVAALPRGGIIDDTYGIPRAIYPAPPMGWEEWRKMRKIL